VILSFVLKQEKVVGFIIHKVLRIQQFTLKFCFLNFFLKQPEKHSCDQGVFIPEFFRSDLQGNQNSIRNVLTHIKGWRNSRGYIFCCDYAEVILLKQAVKSFEHMAAFADFSPVAFLKTK